MFLLCDDMGKTDGNRGNFCFCFFSVLSLFLIVRRNRSTDGNTFHHPNKTEVENFGLYKKESQLGPVAISHLFGSLKC